MILVTGATGFIGRAVVARLLAARRSVAVLVRERDGLDAPGRVAAALGAAARDRVEVVTGDLATPDDVVAPAALRWLRPRVETVIHCAGDASFAPRALAPYVTGHVDGPVALLRRLAGGCLARWAHVSTAFVCGERSGTVRETDADPAPRFHNVYERVKLEAEHAVRAAGRRLGVDVRVLRPSIVVGAAPPTAGGNPSNLFFAFLRLLAARARWPGGAAARLRIEGAPRAPFNLVPLEYVAAAATVLAEHRDAAGGTFHLVVPDAPSQAATLAMLLERIGPCGVSLLDGPPADPSSLERQVARMLEPYRAYLRQDVRFDDAQAAAILRRADVARPTLESAEIGRLVDLALDLETPAATVSPTGR
jgi:2-alkyl-3-oxoalkanoate reductase